MLMTYCEQIIVYDAEKLTSLLQFLTSPLAHLQMTEVCLNDVSHKCQNKKEQRKELVNGEPSLRFISHGYDLSPVLRKMSCKEKRR